MKVYGLKLQLFDYLFSLVGYLATATKRPPRNEDSIPLCILVHTYFDPSHNNNRTFICLVPIMNVEVEWISLKHR